MSVVGLLLSVAIARRSSVSEFSTFAIAMSLYLLVNGCIRSAITETTLSLEHSSTSDRRGFERASIAALFAAVGLVIGSLIFESLYMVVLGLSIHGLTALDYSRTVNSALFDAEVALKQGLSWSIAVAIVALTSFAIPVAPIVVFSTWAGVGALVGYISLWVGGYSWRPIWPRNRQHTGAAMFFSLDYLAGSGGSLLSTNLLPLAINASAVGAIRGAGTVLGPIGLLSTTARSLTISYLSRARAVSSQHEFKSALAVTTALLCAVGPLALSLAFLPDGIGSFLLGESWTPASSVLLPLALESVLALVGSIAAAGHRSRMAGTRSLALRAAVGIPRPFAIVVAATSFGLEGAVWTMAAIAALNVVVWWISYWRLTRVETP
ncbi:MAG: hypothetical protein H7288_21885 [Kineosporiaceae bacterium]|nr:hypothetical protein [Aeromicrobium sp.]